MTLKELCKDATVRGCLAKIKAGDVSAVGVLADYLEENRLPFAKKVREVWDRANYWIAYWSNPDLDMSRKRYTRWQRVSFNRRWMRDRIKTIFVMNWKFMPSANFKSSVS